MKKRLVQVLLYCMAGILAGLLYGGLTYISGWAIPCVFYQVTGLQCPGCGISRMCLSMLHLEFREAYSYNQAVFVLLPLGVAVVADWIAVYIKTGCRKQRKWAEIATYSMAGILVLFGIWRNLAQILF